MDRFVGLGRARVLAHRPGPDGRSSGLSFSEGAPGERRPQACSLANWVHVGPIRRGAGQSPPSRSTVAMVVAETSIPSFRNSPRS